MPRNAYLASPFHSLACSAILVLRSSPTKNRPLGRSGACSAAARPSLPPASPRVPRRLVARLLRAASLLTLLLAGTGCEPTTPAKTAAGAAPAASPPSLPPPPPATPAPAPATAPTAAAVTRAGAAADSVGGPGRDSTLRPAAPAVAAGPAKPAAPARPKGPVLRDTIGNALAARLLGGSFDVNTLRYRRDPATPLMLKLMPRTTLMVGVNSSESRLYRLFAGAPVPPALLARPLALDRLAFEPGQAALGAEAAQQLGNLAALLRTFPKVSLRLYGHSAATEPLFWKLGNARARACLAELLKQGIAPARLHTEWLAPIPKDGHPQGLSVRTVTR